ncbi:nucleolin 1-like [Canna indica]|uniref:Nucleolin 1-like n=1 Tax=Canna indica TaxID=4628 RepID=A0AAQ3KHA1_9LILI|nr:nucleolin 1-like [Canna indica]
MELSAPPHALPPSPGLRRPFLPGAPLLLSSRPFLVKPPLCSRSCKSSPRLDRSRGSLLRAAAQEEAFTDVKVDEAAVDPEGAPSADKTFAFTDVIADADAIDPAVAASDDETSTDVMSASNGETSTNVLSDAGEMYTVATASEEESSMNVEYGPYGVTTEPVSVDAVTKRTEESSILTSSSSAKEDGHDAELIAEAADVLLSQDNVETDSRGQGTYTNLYYGAGALVALWTTSAIISAVDSIPLFSKLMEVVGLGFTLWFSSRYLLFKENRDELFSKIDDLKEKMFGTDDD